MKKVALVLEGGGMRALFTAGVLDVLMENNIEIDCIVSASAGALFGVNYFSNQKGRVLEYTKKYNNDKRYMSFRNLFFTGNIVSKKFAYYKVTKKLVPFDNKTYKKSKKRLYAVVTNVKTGKPEYIKIADAFKDMEYLRATSAVPLFSRIIKINKKKYLDGGISDSIPIKKALSLGYKKIIVVETQPIHYQKKPIYKKNKILLKLRYRRYKDFLKTINNRYLDYNKTKNDIKIRELNKEIFVLRPPEKLEISTFEKDLTKIDNIYNIGFNETLKSIDKLKKYLKK